MSQSFLIGNIKGPKGDTGAAGPTGPQGPQGEQGIQGEKGKAFAIAKVYSSVAAMDLDYNNTAIKVGDFVMISTADPDDLENARLYVKGAASYEFISDFRVLPVHKVRRVLKEIPEQRVQKESKALREKSLICLHSRSPLQMLLLWRIWRVEIHWRRCSGRHRRISKVTRTRNSQRM